MSGITVHIKDPRDFDKMLSKFKKICMKDGFLRELRDRRYFKKPSEIKRERKKNNNKGKRR